MRVVGACTEGVLATFRVDSILLVFFRPPELFTVGRVPVPLARAEMQSWNRCETVLLLQRR